MSTASRSSFFALLLVAATPAAIACSQSSAPPVAGLRVSQPLIATLQGDDSTLIQVRADGCVGVHHPAWDVRAGSYAFALEPAELAELRRELQATRIAGFDPAAVQADLAKRTAVKAATPGITYRVSDEEVIELQVENPGKSATRPYTAITWTGLRAQRLNHPEQPELAALAAARDRLMQLADDRRLARIER